ncbi:hypothetical protein HY971_01500 [Candidatus Kaiserbacteria bacterium]|nr:hypothetical protein [Candidatus Kaiserbacteria bacterium]
MAIGLATTVQATGPVLGTTLASSTFSTGQAGPSLKIDAFKSTALQAIQSQTQFEQAIATSVYFGDGTGKKLVGDNEAAKTGATWAITSSTVGFYRMQAQVRGFDIKDVAVIDKAKHSVITRFVPRQVLYTS